MTRATLRLAFADAHEAARLASALAPENEHFLAVRQDDAVLVLDASADGPLSLLRTLDDALACLGAAQKAGRLARDDQPA